MSPKATVAIIRKSVYTLTSDTTVGIMELMGGDLGEMVLAASKRNIALCE